MREAPPNTIDRFLGILLVAISAAAFGTLAILARYAYAAGMDTMSILFLRFSLAAVFMLVLLILRGERLPRGVPLLQLIAMGGIGYVGQSYCYFTALKYASSGLVALLLYLYPVFVALLSALLLHEPIGSGKLPALGLALLGTALTVSPSGGQPLGIMFAILAAAIYSVYIIAGSRVLRQVSAVQSSLVIFASAAVASVPLMAGGKPHLPADASGWVIIGALVLVATVLPVVTFLAGLERIGATNAAMLSTLEPVVTVLLGITLLGETLQPITLLGGGLILAAVLLLTRSELRRPAMAESGSPEDGGDLRGPPSNRTEVDRGDA
ncbi:MAG TPA: EamA family transporter [Anaerolineae bacterium]|jgi:drug/metabolite transporter (DMT)-like permease|nr:EamA family transporter [Anaerolineae bacterium]